MQPDSAARLPAEIVARNRLLTAPGFHRLADVPPEVEWFANLSNKSTRRAYENAIRDFMGFTGIVRPEEFRAVTRAHVIAWSDELTRRGLGGATIRHRLAALASLFEYLCEKNAVTHNPVKGMERPAVESGEGKTPALGDHQARDLLDAPRDDTIKSKRDRAILSTLLFHALRREELCKLKVKDCQHARKGVPQLRVSGKGGKTRYLPLHPGTSALSMTTSSPPVMVRTRTARCFARPATIAPARPNTRLRRTAFTSWCAAIPPRLASRSAHTRCARPPPPMPWIIRPTSPRCRNGSATRTSPLRASTITGGQGPRTVRHSRWLIDMVIQRKQPGPGRHTTAPRTTM
jgi:integrase